MWGLAELSPRSKTIKKLQSLNMPQDYKPYKNKRLDGRFKIMPKDRPKVIAKYKELKSLKKTGEYFGISKSLVGIITNPIRAKQVKDRIKLHWQDYYDTDYHTKAIKKFRDKKRRLKLNYNKT